VLADLQDRLPCPPAIRGLVEAPVASRSPQRTLGGDEHDIRVARIDKDLSDVLRIQQAQRLPGRTTIRTLVNAVAEAATALRLVLPCAEPDDIGVLRVEGDAADRVRAVVVEDRLPGQPAVRRLPNASGRRGNVPDAAVARINSDIRDAAGGKVRTEVPQRED